MRNNRLSTQLHSQTQKLRVWWDIRKVGFKKRLLILGLVVMSTTFYVVFVHPLMKLASISVYLVSVELFTFIYTPKFLENIWLRLTYKKKTIGIDVPEQIAELANRMGVRMNELRIYPDPDFRNACVIGKTVILGLPVIRELSVDEGLAVVGHEFGHIKSNHFIIRALVVLGAVLSTWSWLSLPPQIYVISSFAYLTTVMIPFNWLFEYWADQRAIKFVGGEHLKSALLKLVGDKNLKEADEDHPSIFNRFKFMDQSKFKRP